MTAETDLLPLPETLIYGQDYYFPDQMRTYARANVAHAIAAKDAEIDALRTRLEDTVRDSTNKIEALRAEVERVTCELMDAITRADKLEEALLEVLIDLERSQANMRNAAKTDPRWEGCADAIQPRVDTARALLRDQEEGHE